MKRIRLGCVVFTQAQGESFISKGIMWSTRKGVTWLPWSREPKTEFSHVACVLHGSNKDIRNTMLVEMTWPEMRTMPLSHYLDQGCKVEIYEAKHLPIDIKKAIAQKLKSYIGKRYGKWKIGLFFIDAMLGKLISLLYVLPIYLLSGGKIKLKGIEFALFSRLDLTGALVCSQSVVKEYWNQGGIHFSQKGYLSCNPDNMHDYVSKSPLWKRILTAAPFRICFKYSENTACRLWDVNNTTVIAKQGNTLKFKVEVIQLEGITGLNCIFPNNHTHLHQVKLEDNKNYLIEIDYDGISKSEVIVYEKDN